VDPSSEEEPSTSDEEDNDVEVSSDEERWCPPNLDQPADPTEEELAGAAEKLETMVAQLQTNSSIFFTPASLGALPALWLQAKLTISLVPFQKRWLSSTIAAELWQQNKPKTTEHQTNWCTFH
jgi:hypothetical protein